MPYEPAPEKVREHGLTEREAEVLCLVAGGMSSKEAAARLGMTNGTARVHLANVRRKLGAITTAEATAKAERLGVIRWVEERPDITEPHT